MKVILKTTVIDRILKEIGAAQAKGREPDYIVLTEEEMKELARDLRCDYHVTSDLVNTFAAYATGDIKDTLKYDVRDFDLRPEYRGGWDIKQQRSVQTRWRSITTSKFAGVPLFVVPKEYMPV